MNEAELIFSEILNCNRLSLYLDKHRVINRDKSVIIHSVFKRRLRGEPLQYILGKTEFMGLEFKVSPDVFIPRPETEILVETVIEIVHSRQSVVHGLKILEIGTGSGCVAVSLAKLLKGANVTATDISNNALAIAKENAEYHRVKINFMQADLFDTIDCGLSTVDLIISNPPYIPSADIDNLQPEIKYEPRIALDGGRDGLDFYRKIIAYPPYYLTKGGFLIMEMGYGQSCFIRNIFKNSGFFEIIEVIRDYNNIDRIVVAQKI